MFQKHEYITFSELWTVHEETNVDDGKVGNIKKAYKMIKFTGYVFINTIILIINPQIRGFLVTVF